MKDVVLLLYLEEEFSMLFLCWAYIGKRYCFCLLDLLLLFLCNEYLSFLGMVDSPLAEWRLCHFCWVPVCRPSVSRIWYLDTVCHQHLHPSLGTRLPQELAPNRSACGPSFRGWWDLRWYFLLQRGICDSHVALLSRGQGKGIEWKSRGNDRNKTLYTKVHLKRRQYLPFGKVFWRM